MVNVGVEGEGQRRAFVDEPYSSMTSAMDPSLMAFGLAEPPFQVEVVLGQIGDGTHKQPCQKASHELRHVLADRIRLLGESPLEFLKLAATVFERAGRWIERVGNRLDLLDLRPQFRLDVFYGGQSTVDACC
jgi:hypothetical protein